jgi:hypothetical protein
MSDRLQKQSEAGSIEVVKRGSVSIPIYYAPVNGKTGTACYEWIGSRGI